MERAESKPLPEQLLHGYIAQSREHAFIGLDPQGTIVGWAGASEIIFGFTAAEVIGQPIATLFTPEDRSRHFDAHELEIARRDSRTEDDRWHLRKDGTRIWVTGSVQAVRDASGALLGFVKTVRDRTDLRAHIEALEREVQEQKAAQQRTHSFLRKLGHELRNPLSPIQMAAHIIEKACSDPKARKAVEILFSQVGALKRLTDDLMDASRLEQGQLELDLERVDLRELLRSAVAGVRTDALSKRLDLQALLPEAPLPVDVDRNRFQQVIANLLNNAMKYTPAGGSVWVKATDEGRDVVVRIEDTGIGIAADTLPRIFRLFSREDRAQDIDAGGLGIGLAVVQEIMELHRGSVQARSAGEGKGAEFTLRLPRAGSAPTGEKRGADGP